MPIHLLTGNDPEQNLAEEQRLFNESRNDPRPRCLFYVNGPCVVMGRNNLEDQWANADLLEQDGIPLIRRFSGGGTVYVDLNVLNYSFIVPRANLDQLAAGIGPTTLANKYIAVFIEILLRALSRLGEGFTASRLSDISLNGRKVSGNAQRIGRRAVLHHGTLMLRSPLEAIERYLPVPPDRPDVSHADFITGLREQGLGHSMDELKQWLAAEFGRSLSGA